MFKTSEIDMMSNNGDNVVRKINNGFPNAPRCHNLHHLHHHHNHHEHHLPTSPSSIWRHSSPATTPFTNGVLHHVSAGNSSFSAPSFQENNNNYSSESSDFHIGKNISDNLMVDLGLSQDFCRLNIIDGQGNNNGSSNNNIKTRGRETETDSYRFGFEACGAFDATNIPPGFTESTRSSPYEGFCNEVPISNFDRIASSAWGVSPSLLADIKWKGHTSPLASDQPRTFSFGSDWNMNQMYHHQMEHNKTQGSSRCDDKEVQLQKPSSMIASYICDGGLTGSQPCGMNFDESRSVRNPLRFSQIMCPKLAVTTNLDNRSHYCPTATAAEKTNGIANLELPEFFSTKKAGGDPVAYRCDNSFIIQGKETDLFIDNGGNSFRGCRKHSHNDIAFETAGEKVSKHNSYNTNGTQICVNNGGSLVNNFPLPSLLTFYSLAEYQGYVYNLAKDQNGCRFLQRMVDKGSTQDMQIVFDGIIDNVVELMMDPFGNYLVQKLLDVCREEQKLHIVCMVTKEPGKLVRISLNTHGTRVVQKLIETLNSRKQISLVKSALQAGFLDLIKDLNGNHVIQRCLQCLSCQDNEFIFYAAAKFCADIATHQHGCCVLQRCIDHSMGKYRDKLVTEICRHGLLLAQDPFGNYVVQYIIEMEIPTASAKLISQFKGNYVSLSTQKFSSHVVEKCLKHIGDSRSRIVRELLSAPHFEQLLQDPYANYVIQSALGLTKGALHATLVEAVRSYKILRTSPYCKRIFSGNLLKK